MHLILTTGRRFYRGVTQMTVATGWRALRDVTAYGVLKLLCGAWSILPLRPRCFLARTLGQLFYLAGRRRRLIALRNLDIAFGATLSTARKRQLARHSFEHAILCAASFFSREKHITDPGAFEVSAEAERLLAGPHPNGLAFLSGHVGDWEMAHHYLGLRGMPTAIVTRQISNRFIDREVTRRRTQRGASTIAKRGALLTLRRLLHERRVVGLLADQNCPQRKHFFPYFGTLASTYLEPARLLARTDVKVVFIACLRLPAPMKFRIIAHDLRSRLPDFAGLPPRQRNRRWAEALVSEYLRAIEDLVRLHPEQALWMHRRWKSRPTGAPWLYGQLERPLDLTLLQVSAAEKEHGEPMPGTAE